MKPLLAANYDEAKLNFPLIAQPKIDGVRGLTPEGRLVGRSLKTHANLFTTARFSEPQYAYMDGELTVGPTNAEDLCRVTTGALNRIAEEPNAIWFVFDDIRPHMLDKPYEARLEALARRAEDLPFLRVIESKVIYTLDDLLEYDSANLDAGMEGTILRRIDGVYKQGRSTVRVGELLRIKRFTEEEAVVDSIEEGNFNGNEAKKNELGRTARSSHQENMVPNGMVGAMQCTDVKTGEKIKVAAGCMPHADRLHYFQNQAELIGQVIKYKHFPVGAKDKPRFPTFQTIRAASDRS